MLVILPHFTILPTDFTINIVGHCCQNARVVIGHNFPCWCLTQSPTGFLEASRFLEPEITTILPKFRFLNNNIPLLQAGAPYRNKVGFK